MMSSQNSSWLSRIPAGWKFGLLLAVSIGLYTITLWQVLLAIVIVALGLLISSKIDWSQLRWPLTSLSTVLALVFVLLGLQTGWHNATVSVLRLLSMCLLAYTVSLTTTFDEMLEMFQRVASPLRFLGANPAQIGLALAMCIRFIPELKRVYMEVREAQHARGLANNPLAVSVPLVIRALRIADDTAEALEARGYDSTPSRQRSTRA